MSQNPYELGPKPYGESAPYDPYDLSYIEGAIGRFGYRLYYIPQTATTMDIARSLGRQKAIVLTNHQTAGRGREGRSWLDEQDKSVLMTLVEPFDETSGDPPNYSPLILHMFSLATCLALQEVSNNEGIKLRWPGDPFYGGQKLGGVLVDENVHTTQNGYVKLFGVGINVHYDNADSAFPDTEYGAISLAQVAGKSFRRQDIVAKLIEKWARMRVDIKTLSNPAAYNVYDTLWRRNAELLGKRVRVVGLPQEQTFEGIVDSHLGNGIILQTSDGKKEEILIYDTNTRIDVLS